MSVFRIKVVARNPKAEERATPPIEAIVDTGSEFTCLPADMLRSIGIEPRRMAVFMTADGKRLDRPIGYAIVNAEGFEANEQVVFGQPGDIALLGVRTLEGFGVAVDNVNHRFIAIPALF